MYRLTGLLAILGLCLASCSTSTGVQVTGTVTLDGETLPGAIVTFRPSGQKTSGLGGTGTTGADGKYTLTEARGAKGLAPGDYTVVISRRLRPDGSAPPVDLPPMDSDARETLPARYSSPEQITLRVTVSKEQASHDFPLVKKKK